MKIQEIVSDVRSRVETAGKQYQDAFKAYVDAQRKAVGVVTKNGHTLANTEIGAAKNVFAAAKASFDKARTDGVRKVARNPQTYVPNGRDQIVSAYKDTIDLLVRTGNELTDVVSSGYKSVLGKLSSAPAKAKKTATTRRKATPAKRAASTTATAAKKPAAAKSTAKRKTASTRKATTASTRTKSATASKPATARKRTTASKTKTAASTASTSTAGNSDSSDSSAS